MKEKLKIGEKNHCVILAQVKILPSPTKNVLKEKQEAMWMQPIFFFPFAIFFFPFAIFNFLWFSTKFDCHLTKMYYKVAASWGSTEVKGK